MADRHEARTTDPHPQIAGSIQRSASGVRRLWSLEEFETLRALVHSLRDGIYITTPEGRVLDSNQAFLDLFGVARVEDFAAINVRDLYVDPDQRAQELELLAREKAVREFEIRIRRPDGTILTVLDTCTAVTDTSTNETAYYGVLIDISDRKRAEDEVARSNSLLAATLDSTADGIVVMDLAGRHVQTYNRRFLEMWHIPAEMAQAPDSEVLLRYALEQLKNPEQALQSAKTATAAGESESYDELELKDGRVFERFSMPQRLGGQPVGRVWSFRDVTARKTAEMRLVHDAFHDPLTGLPNRALFADLLARAIGRARRRKDYQFALLFLDIDRFKVVNDSLGHLVGDQVLVNIARRLERCVRPGDTVARLGGDEFTVLLDDIVEAADTTRVADRIQRELQLPFNIQGQEVFTSASIGITLSRSGYDRPDELLRDADIAMYRAKALGKARYEVFDAEMHARAIHQLQLETDLRRALDREEFRCHYQPVLSLATGRIVGFETLVRWQHPQRGLLGPGEFIDAAEETGLIVLIGRVVLREACRQLHEWQVQFPMDTPLSIAVNVSARQFRQPDLADHIARALTAWDLPPSSLRLEITESTIIENVQAAAESLGRLRELGVRVDLDDFGTGYSSLSYLHQFEMDAIKVDRSFIGKIGAHGENSAIVRTIASLAANLSMELIAEGVERADQGDTLRSLGCDLVQGFLYAPPLTAEAARGMLRAQQEHDRERAAGSR